jgi:ABC-type glycerol-3-phosphate transport system permease component
LASNAIIHVILIVFACLMAFPFLWMVSTALKPQSQVYARPPVLIPRSPQWGNFLDVLIPERLYGKTEYSILPVEQTMRNTIFVAVLSTVGSVLSASFVGYGFARLRFPGREFLFAVLLGTMMVPFMVRMVPLFMIYRDLGWLDTFYPLIVPRFFGGAFDIFLVRQFYRTIPFEYSDAARMDGCSEMGIWSRIMLPLSRPALVVVAIRSFQHAWGDFMVPLIILRSGDKKTLMLGIQLLLQNAEAAHNYQMSMVIIAVLPVIILFFVFQRYFLEGISVTGIKG